MSDNIDPNNGAMLFEFGPRSEALLLRLVKAQEALAAALHAAPAPARDTGGQRSNAPASGDAPTNFPNYGRSKNAPIAGASAQDLSYYAEGARKSIADAAKARWHDKERALLAAIEAEMARQGGGQPKSGGSSADPFASTPIPGHSGSTRAPAPDPDDEIPFALIDLSTHRP